MNYRLSLGISAGLHLIILLALILVSLTGGEPEFLTETIRIRIRMPGSGADSGTVAAGEPSVMSRTLRPVSNLSQSEPAAGGRIEPESVRRTPPAPEAVVMAAPTGVLAADNAVLEGLTAPDPLAGIEVADSPEDTVPTGSDERWSVSWSNGRERAILRVPKLDEDALPQYTERLSGLQIAISVSPAGDVVSAEVLPPGSGDIRIDRYLNSLALELVLEPGFSEEGDQSGILRLVLSEGSE